MKKIIALITLLLIANFASADINDPVEIVAPSHPGGGTGNHGQLVAEMLSKQGMKSIVVYKPGLDQSAGANYVARARPDGRTLLIGSVSSTAANVVFANPNVEYNEKSFVPVVLLNQFAMVLAVSADSPIKNYDQFKKYVRENPGKFTVGYTYASMTDLLYEWARVEGLPRPIMVLYPGSAKTNVELIGGHVPFIWDNLTDPLIPFVADNRVRILAMLDNQSIKKIKKIQPDGEPVDISARHPELKFGLYYGLFAPAGTPKSMIADINRIINQSLTDPYFQNKIQTMGIENIGGSPDILLVLQQNNIQKLRFLLKHTGYTN